MAEELEYEPEATEEPEDDRDARFDALLAGEKPVEEVVEEEVIEEEPEEEETVADLPKVEGPTPAMETVARQAGIPPKLVALARDDRQLQEMIALTEERQEQPPVEEVPKFDISLPEDEYGSDNAVREQFLKMRDHYEGVLSGFREDMASIVGAVSGMREEQTEMTKRGEATVQRAFDDALDGLDSETFGKAGDSMRDAQKGQRGLLFGPYQRILQENPSMSKAEAVKAAVKETLPELTDNNKAKQQRQSLQRQSRQRLGSGQTTPAPEVGPNRDERFDNFLLKLGK